MIKSKVSIKEAMICLRENSYTEKEAIGQAKLYSRTIKQILGDMTAQQPQAEAQPQAETQPTAVSDTQMAQG